MFSPAIHNARRQMGIAVVVTLLAWASIAWGVLEMHANGGKETLSSGLKIGLALLPGLLAPFMVLNFWWADRIVSALRRGENMLGRWRVEGDGLAAFLAMDTARNALGAAYLNDWAAPKASRIDALDIIFGKQGVLVDNSYFPLVKSGFYKFTAVGILPGKEMSIEFVTVATMVSNISAVTIRRFPAVLRLPIMRADCPDALTVLDHYRKVLSGEVNANPGFYRTRIRFGLIGAAVFLSVAMIGFAIGPQSPDYLDPPSMMMIFGGIFGFASLLLAALAWLIGRRQK